jgi:glycine dehydrogenase subunit 1
MDFISNQQPQIEEMLNTIGFSSINDVFSEIPADLLLTAPQIDDGISEYEGIKLMEALANKNSAADYESYLGGGAYEHHVPAIVSAITQKSEFLTAYTPYQAEASQGGLQTIFEYQSAICTLTGMDVSNASLYDGASACAEAVLMSLRLQPNQKRIVIMGSLNPNYRGVVDQYLRYQEAELITIPFNSNGSFDINALDKALNENTAAILVQYPNFFGVIDDLKTIRQKAKDSNALFIVCANPIVYGLYASAAELGADIAVGDCQPLGINLQFGGPYVGYIACKYELVRQLPGRIVGETVDSKGRRGFVLTMQAREQHIRREKATSNICTNQALAALATLITIAWYGKEGIQQLALTNYQRACYLREELSKIPGIKVNKDQPILNEFVATFDCPLETLFALFRENKIEPGIPLSNNFPEMKNSLLIAVTETKDLSQLNRYVSVAKQLFI